MIDDDDLPAVKGVLGRHRRAGARARSSESSAKQSELRLVGQKRWNDASNYVLREQHPLRTGLYGKLYNRFDRVEPVVEAWLAFSESRQSSNYLTGLRQEMRRRQEAQAPAPVELQRKPVPAPVALEQHPNPQAFFDGVVDHLGQRPTSSVSSACQLCDSKQVEMTVDKDGFVCMACGTITSGLNTISMNRERNCEESEDKTIRADPVYQPKVTRFDRPAPSAEETRRERTREQSQTYISTKQAKKMGIGFIHQHLNRRASVEARANGYKTDMNPEGWTQSERSKADQLMRELEKLIRDNPPSSKQVQYYLRMRTTYLWSRVVTHERACCGGIACKKKLSGRTTKSISEAAFDYHIDQLLLGGAAEANQIPHEEVRTLKERWSSSRRPVNAHMVSTRAMVSLIMEQDVELPCVDSEASSPSPARAESPSLVHSPERQSKLARTDSMVPDPHSVPRAAAPGAEEGVSPLLVFRQSILRVYKLFQSGLPLTVKEKATGLLADKEFMNALYDSCSPSGREGKSAYALLMALDGSRPKHGKERVPETHHICRLVGIGEDEAQKLTAEVASLLPSDTWTESGPSEEFDGLF